MSSAFAALVVYAQEAVPGRVGMVSGVMFGLMFGISGIGAAGWVSWPTAMASSGYTRRSRSCRCWAW